MTPHEPQAHRIAAVLAETRAAVHESNLAAWEVQAPAPGGAVRVHIADDWLLFVASLEAGGRGSSVAGVSLPEQLLQWNALLPGGAKFGVDALFNLTLRAEVPLFEDVDPGARLLEGWNGIEAGFSRFQDRPEELPAPVSAAAADLDLVTLAGETGWTFTGRQDGRIAFELPSPSGAFTATMHTRVGGGVRVWVSLAELSELTAPARQALAVLLLRAAAVLRLARPAFAIDGEERPACLEAVFDSAPNAAELTQALESLVVGVALAAAEARLLCEEQTAREFLNVETWTPREQDNNNNNPTERTR